LVVGGDSGVEAEADGWGPKGGVGRNEDRSLVDPDCRHRERARTEPVVRGLWVNALVTCPLGQVHAPNLLPERVFVVYH